MISPENPIVRRIGPGMSCIDSQPGRCSIRFHPVC
jgi:hypothetical protein